MVAGLVCVRCDFRAGDVELGTPCPIHPDLVLVPSSVAKRFHRAPCLGRVLDGKYALVDIVGSGGMGAVYRALRLKIGGEVAVKVIQPAIAEADATVRQRFFGEAKIMAKLTDPGVVTLIDYGEEPDGLLFIVLELVDGRSLQQILRKERALAPARAVGIACHVLNALEKAHDLGLIHRDIKPGNIMLIQRPDGGEVVKLLDFGLSKSFETVDGHEAAELTDTGVVLGTPRYLSPEQAAGVTIVPQSDLYSLGVVLYLALTGRAPFDGKSGLSLLQAHVEAPPPSIPPDSGVPPALEAAVLRALAKTPAGRYESARAMRDALYGSLEGQIPPSDISGPSRGSEQARSQVYAPLYPLTEETETTPMHGAFPEHPPPRTANPPHRQRWLWLVPAFAVVGVAALLYDLEFGSAPRPSGPAEGSAAVDRPARDPVVVQVLTQSATLDSGVRGRIAATARNGGLSSDAELGPDADSATPPAPDKATRPAPQRTRRAKPPIPARKTPASPKPSRRTRSSPKPAGARTRKAKEALPSWMLDPAKHHRKR